MCCIIHRHQKSFVLAQCRTGGQAARFIGFISGCSAVGSARGLGPWGRRFESCHSDHLLLTVCLYDGIRRHSSAGQSARFTSVRSGVRSPLSPPKERLQTKRFAVFYLFCKLREGSEPYRRCCGGLPSGRAATDKECERFAKQTNEAKLRSPLSPPKGRLQTKRFAVFLITQFTKT